MINNVSVLPFYSSIAKQHHRKAYAYGKVYPLLSPLNTILPTQIKIPRFESFNSITATIYKLDGTVAYYNAQSGWANVLAKRTAEVPGYGLYIFNLNNMLSSTIKAEGQYYIRLDLNIVLTSGGSQLKTYYSEVFTWANNLSSCLKLEYWDQVNLPIFDYHIDYEAGFKNVVYLQTQLGKPEYPFEEEVIKRDGYDFPEKQISEKKFRFTFLAPEYLIDALRLVRLHDNIEITNIDGEVYRANSFLISVAKWEDQGDLAVVEAEFECETIIKKIGKGYLNS